MQTFSDAWWVPCEVHSDQGAEWVIVQGVDRPEPHRFPRHQAPHVSDELAATRLRCRLQLLDRSYGSLTFWLTPASAHPEVTRPPAFPVHRAQFEADPPELSALPEIERKPGLLDYEDIQHAIALAFGALPPGTPYGIAKGFYWSTSDLGTWTARVLTRLVATGTLLPVVSDSSLFSWSAG